VDFVKMEGLGNDFIVVDGPIELESGRIAAWCERQTGIGADGVLMVTPLDERRVQMRYWNADGGPAEMCGNGLRCVALLARRRGWVGEDSFVVESAAGSHPVAVLDDEMVRAFVGRPHQFRVGQLAIGGYTVVPVGVGNPHAVIIVESVDDAPVPEAGPRVEGDPMFPGGTNVEFVEVVDRERIRVRVWERGVGETRASGTGATAAAFVAHFQELTGSVVTVELPGGELEISLDDAGAWMVGPARVVYSGAVA
jgi:diaminopimelate epimerase